MNFSYQHTSRLRCVFLLLHFILHLSEADRRILGGKELKLNRNYVVYMLKANATIPYDAWICGGAIVSKFYIITSAACVEDVKYMYAIAGYRNYVHYDDIESDDCTKYTKKKIVRVCLPKDYSFNYPRVERWANIDIALAKVEKEYNFQDEIYLKYCSYRPDIIDINYDVKLQAPGTDALVFGWGHTEKWRSMEDTRDYNQDVLLYGSVELANKEDCKKEFEDDKIKNIIEKYMICTMGEGKLDDKGDVINSPDGEGGSDTFAKACGPGGLRIGGKCVYDFTRMGNTSMPDLRYTRRRGICQNDHGGPIITWRGPKEVLLGIASVFKVEEATKACIPPFLFTSTHCNGAFIHCLLDSKTEKDSLRCERLAKESGIEIVRRAISWVGHPDGPAYNEIHGNARREDPDNYKPSNETLI